MKRTFLFATSLAALAALLGTTAGPAGAQNQYFHQDLNSTAARALRQEIMNRAIIRQATGKRGAASRKAKSRRNATRHTAAQHR